MEKDEQPLNHKILPDILSRIERYEQGIQRHQNAQKPSKLGLLNMKKCVMK